VADAHASDGDADEVSASPDPDVSRALDAAVRADYGRILATLIRTTGDVDRAEDAVHDAVVRALSSWSRSGIPAEPRAWLTVTARRCAIDVARRESTRDDRQRRAVLEMESEPEVPDESVVRDDLLRLLFTCCHPTLGLDAQVALALRTLGGLSTAEVARVLLLPEATAAKRLTRAKQKIALARIPYRVPADADLPARLAGVLGTVYLMFTEGYSAGSGDAVVRVELADEAIRLGTLVHELMPDEAGATGLLALMVLQDARRATRVDEEGLPRLLSEQDRRQWDAVAIRRGVTLVGEGLRRTAERPDPYVVQAAIAACHALAPDYEQTDWDSVIGWYDVLLGITSSPAARLGRASAVAERDGAVAGLAEVDAITGLDDHVWWHAARVELLVRLDRRADAAAELEKARELGLVSAHARRLKRRLGG
jgi:RNA polymerase sigma factor (sigma-70 family)